jgi:hypothetical protein
MRRAIFLMITLLIEAVLFVRVAAETTTNQWTREQETIFARQHVFMVNNDGVCIDPRYQWKLPGGTNSINIYRDCLTLIEAGIREWCRTNQAGDKRIVVFVHGGMNPYSDSLDRMNRFGPMMMATNCYPIFVVWNSGPFSSYWDHLTRIRQGKEHHKIGRITAPFVFISDLARGVARFPVTFSGQIYNDFRTTEWPRDATNCPVGSPMPVKRWEGFESMIASNIPNTYHPPQEELDKRSWTDRNCRFVEYIITLPTKILTLPILDGMGTEAWDIMLRRTRTMFERTSVYEINGLVNNQMADPNFSKSNYLRVSRWLIYGTNVLGDDTPKRGAMILFGKKLAEWSTNCSACFGAPGLPFEFYGHSMGTIVLDEMFQNIPNIRAKRIVYLGAACSIEDFEASIFSYLRLNTNAQFYSVSLHRMAERQEYSLYSWPVVGNVPILRDLVVRGSLLNWIDAIFAKPNTITDRTLGSWENITRSLPDIPLGLRGRVHFRGCDIEPVPILGNRGGAFEPQIHGNFANAMFWNTNFFWPLGTNQLRLLNN